jgi:3-dehydroquinate synthase
VETLSGYGTYLHGEAVALGMLAAGEISAAMGLWSGEERRRQETLIAAAQLPLRLPPLDPDAVLRCLQADKKVRGGRVRFVLPTGIGTVEVRDDVGADLIRGVLARLSG